MKDLVRTLVLLLAGRIEKLYRVDRVECRAQSKIQQLQNGFIQVLNDFKTLLGVACWCGRAIAERVGAEDVRLCVLLDCLHRATPSVQCLSPEGPLEEDGSKKPPCQPRPLQAQREGESPLRSRQIN